MLAAHHVQFERFYRPIFEPVSFALDPGGLLLVTGPNGCGKTTLIRLLAGLLQPASMRWCTHPPASARYPQAPYYSGSPGIPMPHGRRWAWYACRRQNSR